MEISLDMPKTVSCYLKLAKGLALSGLVEGPESQTLANLK